MVEDGFEKGDVALTDSGAVARRGVSGRKVVLLLIAVVGLSNVSTTSEVGETGVKGGSETAGTILKA